MEVSDLQISLRLEITDESIAAGNAMNPALICQCDPHGFQYAVLDQDRKKFIALRDYRIHTTREDFQPGFFQQIYEHDALLRELRPVQTVLAVYPACNVLVPGPLFSRENAVDFLKLTCSQSPSIAFFDKLRFADVYQVYNLPGFLSGEIEEKTGEVILTNAITAFIDQQLMLHKHYDEPVVSVNVRHGFADVIVCNGSALLFSNTFIYNNAEDFIYFLLFSMEQLQLNPDQTEVKFYGDIERTSAAWLVSRKYIRHADPGQRPEGSGYSYGFSKISPHQYFSLFAQQLCVS